MKQRSSEPAWATLRGVLLIAALYGLIHGAMRMALSGAIPIDDALESFYAQGFDWGYRLRQPPLYDWLLIALQRVFGPTLAPHLLLKYAALTAACGATYACATRLMAPRLAALCAFSLSALYQLGWNAHEGVTHSILLTAAVPLSALALMRWIEAPSTERAAALGAALAFGMLSKHGFFASMAIFALALALTPELRRRTRLSGALVALATAALFYAPYALWMLGQERTLLDVSQSTLAGRAQGDKLTALGDALLKPLLFLTPMLALPPALLWAAGRRAPAPARDWLRFFRHVTLLSLALLLIGAAFFGMTTLKERHLHALFLTTPIWLFGEAARRAARPLPAHGGLMALGALAGLVLLFRLAGLLAPEAPFCPGKCYLAKPYDMLTQLDAPDATLVAPDSILAANLRRVAPRARIALLEPQPWRAPGAWARCLLVWDMDRHRIDLAPNRVIEESWPHLWKEPGWRVARHGVANLDPDDPRCR